MSALRLSPLVLDWAASQSGSSLPVLAAQISKRDAAKIEDGQLTDIQAAKFSRLASVPFGYLFLSQPPAARALPIADFRRLADADPLDRNFYDIYDDIVFKQAWYKEYLTSIGAQPLEFVGKYSGSASSIPQIAENIRQTLKIDHIKVAKLKTADDHFSYLSARCEAGWYLGLQKRRGRKQHASPSL